MADKKKFPIAYKVLNILTTKFSFENTKEEEVIELFDTSINLGLKLNSTLDINIEKSIINIDINTLLINLENEKCLVEHSCRTVYDIQNLDKVYNEKNKTFDIPTAVLIQLYGLAYTHARAFLVIEISPTNYKNRYILPVIDPSQLIEPKAD